MRIRIYLMALLCVVALSGQARKKQLVILHTNDTHSTIMPLNKNLADTLLAGRGGYLRRVVALEDERKKYPDLLLFDSGDFSQGSPYYNFYKGDVEIGLMNMMKYDAATIGNHEFDFGLDNMARLFRKANFPIVCSNYDFTGTPVEGTIKPYIILKRKGMKIGIFGLCPQLEGLVDNRKMKGVKYLDPIEKGNEMAAFLKKKKKCDLVICLSHLGWDNDGLNDHVLISHTNNIDVVLGGHSHSFLTKLEYVNDASGHPVVVDQNGNHALFVGKLLLDMDNTRHILF